MSSVATFRVELRHNRLVAVVAVLFLLFLSLVGHSAEAQTVTDDPAYAHPERLIDIGSGRRLNLYCIGTGGPTVVFEAGLSSWNMVWADVQPAIAKITRACSYDRAGLGFSDPSPRASSAANTVDDLHALLHAAGIESPIILVGHSVGGAYVRLYADKYPSDVVGMVLVDPVHEDSMLWDAAADGGPDPRMLARYERFRKCSDADSALPRGFVPGTDLYKTCIFGPDSHFGPKLNAAGLAIEMKPSFQLAQLSEFSNGYSGVSFEQIREGRRFYGDMPLIVLSKTPDPSTLPKEQQTPQLRVLWELHEQLSALSMRGEHRGIANTGHDIQLDQPHAVIQAIKDVIALTAGGK